MTYYARQSLLDQCDSTPCRPSRATRRSKTCASVPAHAMTVTSNETFHCDSGAYIWVYFASETGDVGLLRHGRTQIPLHKAMALLSAGGL
jgi:hypothetical protein